MLLSCSDDLTGANSANSKRECHRKSITSCQYKESEDSFMTIRISYNSKESTLVSTSGKGDNQNCLDLGDVGLNYDNIYKVECIFYLSVENSENIDGVISENTATCEDSNGNKIDYNNDTFSAIFNISDGTANTIECEKKIDWFTVGL